MSKVVYLSKKVSDQLKLIREQFKDRLQKFQTATPGSAEAPIPVGFRKPRTAGGINIYEGRILPAFNFEENRA